MKNIVQVEGKEGACQLAHAFEEDTRCAMWPPRSYTCSFCRKEFRSAQALGGHMNVHRRDRAYLHHKAQSQAQFQDQTRTQTLLHHQLSLASSSNDPFLNWANEAGVGVATNKELSFFYQFANYNNSNNEIISNLEIMPSFVNDEMQVSEMLPEVIISNDNEPFEELDLELRLGHIYTN